MTEMTVKNIESMNLADMNINTDKNTELGINSLNAVNGGVLFYNAKGQRTLCNGKLLTPDEVDEHISLAKEIMSAYDHTVAAITLEELGFDDIPGDYLVTHTIEEWAASQKSKLM